MLLFLLLLLLLVPVLPCSRRCLGGRSRQRPCCPSLLRPADIRYNAGNPAKANALLGWHAQHHMPEVVRLMTAG